MWINKIKSIVFILLIAVSFLINPIKIYANEPKSPVLLWPTPGESVSGDEIHFKYRDGERSGTYDMENFDLPDARYVGVRIIDDFNNMNGFGSVNNDYLWFPDQGRISVDGSNGHVVYISGFVGRGQTVQWSVYETHDGSASVMPSQTFVNTPASGPGNFVLNTPVNTAGKSLTFTWGDAERAYKYTFQVSITPDYSKIIYNSGDLSYKTKSLLVPNIFKDNGMPYYCKVTAWNSYNGGSTSESLIAFYNGPSDKPGAISLTMPRTSGKELEFDWNDTDRAYYYYFKLYTKDETIEEETLTYNYIGYIYPYFNDNGETYTCDVTAWNSIGSTSSTKTFVNGPTAKPVQVTSIIKRPDDGVTLKETSVEIEWEGAYGALDYIFQASPYQDFREGHVSESSARHSLNTSSYVIKLDGLILDGGIIYWRINTSNSIGYVKGDTHYFYAGDKPKTPVPSAPLTNFYGAATAFSWNISDDADDTALWYVLEIATEPGYPPESIQFSEKIKYNIVEFSGFSNRGDTYYWHVKAVNLRGESEFCDDIIVTNEASDPPEAPVLLFPDDGAVITQETIDLKWTAMDRATEYCLELDGVELFVGGKTYKNITISHGDKHSWRVRALNKGYDPSKNTSPYSETRTFSGNRITNCDEPAVGDGYGALSYYYSDIDIAYSINDQKYKLYDMSRRFNQNTSQHNHNGRMNNNAGIITYIYYDPISKTEKLSVNDSKTWNNGTIEQQAAVDAHVNAGRVYDYMNNVLGINGYDLIGGDMSSVVECSDGGFKDNARWNPFKRKVQYGKSDMYKPFSSALDIVGHEWGHAFSCVFDANLAYVDFGQRKAFEESFSDFFGEAVEFYCKGKTDWINGGGISSKSARNLSDPTKSDPVQPDSYLGINWLKDGSPYQHCGVPNKMFYLLANGGRHNDVDVAGIGIVKAMKIAIMAKAYYMRTVESFLDISQHMMAGANDVRGLSKNEIDQVEKAWRAVSVTTDHSTPSINTTNYTFGTVPMQNRAEDVALEITNNGAYDLNITEIKLNPDSAPSFTIESSSEPVTLKRFDKCSVKLKFSPATLGPHKAELIIGSESNSIINDDVCTPVIGEGGSKTSVSNISSISTRDYDFGSTLVSSSSIPLQIFISNSGTARLDLSGILTNSTDYTIKNIPQFIDRLSTGIIEIVFNPTKSDKIDSVLNLITNDPNNKTISILLHGYGLGPKISVSPEIYNFGDIKVKTQSASLNITITNDGSTDLIINSLKLTNMADFSLTADQVITIISGQQRTISVKFNPQSEGINISATLRIVSNDLTNENMNIQLYGNGTTPHISVVSPIDFGSVKFNTDETRQIEVTNTGTASLRISNIVLSSDQDRINYRLPNYPLAQTLLPGGSMRFNVIFRPKSDGILNATVQIYSDDLSYPVKNVVLTGVGLAPVISADECSFGDTQIGASVIKDIQINNTGNDPLLISSVSDLGLSDDSDQLCFSLASCIIPMYIAPNSFQSVGIQFNPLFEGIQNAKLRVKSNDPANSVYYVPIVGYGTPGYDLYLHDLTITNHTGVVSATNTIKTGPGITIGAGTDVTFKAGNSIKFGPGFTVIPGAKFRAELSR